MTVARWAGWLSGLWAGVLLGIGTIGAPSGFASASPEMAGRMAGRMFAIEAYVSLVAAVLLYLLVRRLAREGSGSVLSANVLLVLGTLFCTVAGYFALQPMMASARAGQGTLSFGMLHGLSAGFYAVKMLLVSSLAWRLAAR